MTHIIDSTTLDMLGSYSFQEVETPFTWHNGKKIFKKTVNTGSLPTQPGNKQVNHNIGTFDQIVRIDGIVYLTGGDAYTLPMLSATTGATIAGFSVLTSTIRLATSVSVSTAASFITLYYTK